MCGGGRVTVTVACLPAVAEFFSDDSNFGCVRGSITCNETVHVHVLRLVSPTQLHFECCCVLDDS